MGAIFNLTQEGEPTPKTTDPLLTVGTFASNSGLRGTGSLVVFDKLGAGVVYRTSTKLNSTVTQGPLYKINLQELQAVNMDSIKLTKDAIYASINTGAYILDKAEDGTIATYFIDPSISNNLQRVLTLNRPPLFPSAMAATASGSVIILYAALNDGQARLHFLNTTSKEWDKPYVSIPEPDPTSSPPAGNNIAAVVGGAIGGVALLAITAYLFMRHRRQRNSGNSRRYDSNNSSGSGIPNYKEEKFPLSEQRPRFPAGVGLAYGEQYEIDLNVSLLAPQGIPLQPQYHKPPAPRVDPSELDQYAYLETDAVQGPQDWNRRPQVGLNIGINGYIPPALRRPPTPPLVPTRPSNYAQYSLIQSQNSAPI
ncbi:hypothetical protein EC991_002762 [Linnemannia zychae]|nr:hypothetical protein EC991_002762 [Linnemannia zychae]